MNPIESFLQLIGSKAFAESIFSGVAGDAAYDAVKPTIEKIKSQLSGKPASEEDLKDALEDLMIQIGAHTNLNINQLRAEILAAIGQKSAEIPRQLTRYTPISSDECIGRDEDLEKLADALQRSPKVVVVNGLGGIGKTTLAKFWLQGALSDYDHFAWIEMAGNDDRRDQRVPDFLETVAYHPELADNLRLSFGEKEPPENRFLHIMNALRQLKGRNLLVVDNAGADLEQKEIREQLPLPPAWQVLVTSRSQLHGYELMRLDRLSPEHAADLFRLHFSGDCPEAELDELLQEVDYHTLTVELLAKTLENHLGSLTISELLAKLRRRELADPELQRRIALNHSAEETEVYLHLLATFDVAGLDDQERLLLARFAAMPPGGAYSAAQLEEWGFHLPPSGRAGGGVRALQETLIRLDRKGWLTRSAQNTFSLHRMIQQAALYQLQPGIAELGVLVEVFNKKMNFDTSINFTQLFQWILYAEQLLAMLPEDECGHAEVNKLRGYLEFFKSFIDFLQISTKKRVNDFQEFVLKSLHKEMHKLQTLDFETKHELELLWTSSLKKLDPDRMFLSTLIQSAFTTATEHDLVEPILAVLLKQFGHENLSVSVYDVGTDYLDIEEEEKAKELFQQAYNLFKKHLGEQHPATQNAKAWLEGL